MKDDEKRPQREEKHLPSEEDMDFEILDALEQLDPKGSLQSQDLSDETIELNLDDEDMDFGNETSDAGGGFRFDNSLREGLEQELLQDDSGFDIDTSLEDDLVKEIQTGAGDDSFALDLDLDEELSSGELDLNSDESDFDMSAAETLAFKYHQKDSATNIPSLEDESDDDLGSYDLDLGSESDEIDLGSFSDSDDDFPGLDLGIEGVEISEEFADLGQDLDLGSSLEEDSEDEELPGKAVISVGDDEVIDLGDEENLTHEQSPETPEQPAPSPSEAETEQFDESEQDEEIPSPPEIELDLHEEEDDANMMEESFEDIAIDLQHEAETSFEEDSDLDEEDFPLQSAAEQADEELPTPERDEMAELVNDVLDEEQDEEDTREEEAEFPEGDEEPESPETDELSESDDEEDTIPDESVEAPSEDAIDVREFLELTLRLSDEQVEEFEAMICEAKTLQAYLDELEEHHGDVKENIYHKLQNEYVDRKTVIFKSDAFTSLLADVQQDLEDMLDKRAGFVETVERLNEELEEIKVRHLVGEYDDSTLSDKQDSQNAEIALWNEKTEKIEGFITRYQESLDAEKVLNPLRQTAEELPEEEDAPLPEDEAPAEEEITESPEPDEALEEEVETEEEPEENAFFEEDAEEAPAEEEELPMAEADEEDIMSALETLPEIEEEEETSEDGETESESAIEDFFATDDDDETEEEEELDEEFPMDGEFETGDFVLDDLAAFGDEDDEEESEVSINHDVFVVDDEASGDEPEDMIACSKCGRQTPAAEKFCIHCGGKAQKAEQGADVSCKKCGRQTPAAEKFCIHCGGKAQ